MSNYIKATNFYAKDALLSGDPDKIIKGAEIDDEYNAIATAIATKANLNSPNFTGTPTVPTAPAGTNTTQIASTAFVLVNGVPSGAILLWSGSVLSIPSGWLLCNGSNGTPDLRNRFVVGAGSTYAVGATGGSANATLVSHSHTVGTTSLTGQIRAISEAFTASGTASGVFSKFGGVTANNTPIYVDSGDASGVNFDASHTHTLSTEGSSATNANLPPYYALCYIMKA